ncbi:DUF805 domain-containing protein [Providencia manganoxydans]|uniref:DUF805 domain-containing protein n=3 Tax=Morganellaceae TaxID=1903414 RepID=A0A1S1HKJ0_PROST|nr:DUF805 domain-containing protein [Providencia stuartii]OHT22332.1 hypothetical protein A3Q29_10955 [Providencia stuartii]QQO63659.1 DUF805 domain-containing protein [Providencia manganoxydans]
MLTTILHFLKTSFSLKGRATRWDYWSFQIFNIPLINLSIYILNYTGRFHFPRGELFDDTLIILAFAYLIFGATYTTVLTVRRLHDIGYSGWLVLIQFIPYLGFILVFAMFFKGDVGPNKFGDDPKQKD